MGIIGCLLSFVIVIFLVYKNWSVLLAGLAGALVCIAANGLPLWDSINDIYLSKMVAFIGSFFLIYLFGCIEAQIYSRSGAALAIADAISGWINLDKMPQQRKQLMAMLILTLIGTVLAYGGIIVTVVIILLYPISLSLLEKADIPKKFVLGILANGTFTFALTGPGSPQTTNIVAMNFLGTSSTSGLVAGIIGSLAELAVTLFVLNAMINRARAAGEHFAYHEKDEVYAPGREKPGFLLAVFPLAAVFLLFIVFGVRIEYALAAGAVLSLAAFWKYLREEGVQPVLNAGALSSISPVFTVGAIVGFAGIVTSTEDRGDPAAAGGAAHHLRSHNLRADGRLINRTARLPAGDGARVHRPAGHGPRARPPCFDLCRKHPGHAAIQRLHPHAPACLPHEAQGDIPGHVRHDGAFHAGRHGGHRAHHDALPHAALSERKLHLKRREKPKWITKTLITTYCLPPTR